MTASTESPAVAGDSADEPGAMAVLLPLVFGAVQGQLVSVAAELDLAGHLRAGPRTLEDLATRTGAEPAALARILRALVALGVLARDADRYACTAAGALLRQDSPYSMHHYARMNNREWLLRVLPALPAAVRTGRDAFEATHATGVYGFLQAHPGEAAIFHAALTELSRQDALALRSVVDFAAVRRLVDLGGGEGLLVRALLDACPGLEAVLVDLPEVVREAGANLAAHVAAGRCRIVGADFRQAVLPQADLYVLKRVASTCAAADVALLLRQVRAAIPPHGRLLVADPELDSIYGALFDVLMLVATGGGLRTAPEMAALLESAGFRLARTLGTPATLRVFEAVPA